MNAPSVRSRRAHGLAAWFVALSVLLSACQGTASAGSSGPTIDAPGQASAVTIAKPRTTPAVLDVFPADQATNVRPDAPVTVKASSGTLGAVALVGAKGDKVAGRAGPDGTWRTSELLRPSTAYTLTVSSTGPDGGKATTTTSSFTTLKPKVRATYHLIPSIPHGATVGVGMPVIVQFDSAVATKATRAQVEKRVKVTSIPAQEGAWGWLDSKQLMWRPATYWKSGTKVTVSTPLHGVRTGVDRWITGDDGTSFTIGSSMISTVDINTHTMTVRKDGKVIRTIPVSTGKPGRETETRSGTKVIMERKSNVIMDSATLSPPIPKSDPRHYYIPTKWAMRVTTTGEYLHSAPWSRVLGTENASHGCTNMYPADAEWMFEHSKLGDVVTFTGSTRPMIPTDGIGVWVYDFAHWKARSALV